MGNVLPFAVCPCGHKGNSNQPEHYKCGYCYYSARADKNGARAQRLRAQACKLVAEAVKFRAKATAFKARHKDVESAYPKGENNGTQQEKAEEQEAPT